MRDGRIKVAAVAMIVLTTVSGAVHADRAELEKKLKQEIAVDLDDVTIEAALREIGGEAGLRIELSEEAVWKLPDGAETRLSVKLEGQLGKSLEEMFNSFFMRYAVGSEALTVYPRAELKRIIGRPTAEELKLLTDVYSSKMWISVPSDADERNLERLVRAILRDVTIAPADELPIVGKVIQRMASGTPSPSAGGRDGNSPRGTPLTMALLLEEVERSYDGRKTWYLEGPEFPRQGAEVRIVTREEFWNAHLDQVLDVSFSNQTGESVIGTLAAWGDLTIQFPEGRRPDELVERTVTLEVQNTRLLDVLQRAAAACGVYENLNVSTGTLELRSRPARATQEAAPPAPSETTSGGGYVGKISIPMDGGSYFIEFMLRESDLTDELRQLRQEKLREILTQLSKAAKEQE